MKNTLSLLPKQIGYVIINHTTLKPIHSFYRFSIYEVNDGLDLSPRQRRNRLHYQIEGSDVRVVVRFYLNLKNEFHVKYYRNKTTDPELAEYCVKYWIKNLQEEKIVGNKRSVKNLHVF
jgi:hypothetical protein